MSFSPDMEEGTSDKTVYSTVFHHPADIAEDTVRNTRTESCSNEKGEVGFLRHDWLT